jgi:hypothetical protein
MLARASLVVSLAFTCGPCLNAQSLVSWELVCEDDFEDGVVDPTLWIVDRPLGCSDFLESGGVGILRNAGGIRLADGLLDIGEDVKVTGSFRVQSYGHGLADALQVTLFANPVWSSTGGVIDGLQCGVSWIVGVPSSPPGTALINGWGSVEATLTEATLWDGNGNWTQFEIEAVGGVASFRVTEGSNVAVVVAPYQLESGVGRAVMLNNRECHLLSHDLHIDDLKVYRRVFDCDGDGIEDATEIAMATALDCNANGFPDACEITLGFATDFDSNGIPDDCVAPLLNTNRTQASVTTGAQVQLTLRAGTASALDVFVILGSASGTVPGLADPVTGLVLPLNFDPYFELLYASSGAGIVAPFFGFLDANGNATATVTVPAGTNPSLVGLHLDHAYLTIDLFGTGLMGLASNPVPLELTL